MRIKRTVVTATTIALLAGCACLAVVVQPGRAGAAATAGLPITSESQIIADTAHGHLFISESPETFQGGGAILVTDLNGNTITTLNPGGEGMALSSDGSTLYVADPDGAVNAFSTTTLKETASYPLPADDDAYFVAVQSGMLWVSYRNGSTLDAAVGSIDPANANSFTPNALPASWFPYPPQIAADPSDTGVLVTSSIGITPPTVASWSVANPAAVTETASASIEGCGTWHSLAVLPGGTTFLCDGTGYSTADLSQQLSSGYPAGDTAAVAPDGAVALAEGGPATVVLPEPVQDLWVYSPGGTSPAASYSVNAPDNYHVDAAWSADSLRLFAIVVTVNSSATPTGYTLTSLYPFRVATTLTLTASAKTVGYNGKVTLTAHLGTTYTSRTVAIYATPAGSGQKLLTEGTVNANGTLSVATTLTRDTTFAAVFSGDDKYAPRTATLAVDAGVKIAAAQSGYYKSTGISGTEYRVYHRTATLKDVVTVTPDKSGECVKLQVQEYGNGAWRADTTTGCRALSKTSQATLTLKLGPTGRFRVQVDFVRAAKDTTNVSTDGSWLYYEVTR